MANVLITPYSGRKQREEDHMYTEVGVMQSLDKEHMEPVANGKGKERLSSRAFRETQVLPTSSFLTLASRTVRQ